MDIGCERWEEKVSEITRVYGFHLRKGIVRFRKVERPQESCCGGKLDVCLDASSVVCRSDAQVEL